MQNSRLPINLVGTCPGVIQGVPNSCDGNNPVTQTAENDNPEENIHIISVASFCLKGVLS